MSHAATNWAIQQRGLKPAAKVVLWHLCDRYNPDHGCFPDQDTLATDCEMSRSSVNNQLNTLEKEGLIVREQRIDPYTRKQESTRYRFPFEDDFPCPKSGHGSVSKIQQKPSLINGKSRVQNLDSNPVREPVSKPVIERERASADDSGLEKEKETTGQTAREIEAGFKRNIHQWPTGVSDSHETGRREWSALTDEQRIQAETRRDDFIAHCGRLGRSRICSFATYCREHKWEGLPPPEPEPERTHLTAPPWGKTYGAFRLARLIGGPIEKLPAPTSFLQSQIDAGGEKGERIGRQHLARHGYPVVNAMHERARDRQAFSVPVEFERLGERLGKCKTDDPVWEAWEAEHERRCWPWFDCRPPEWVWMPVPDDAEAHADPAEFVRQAIEDFKTALAANEESADDDRAA